MMGVAGLRGLWRWGQAGATITGVDQSELPRTLLALTRTHQIVLETLPVVKVVAFALTVFDPAGVVKACVALHWIV